MNDITRYQLSSLSALPFWFGPFYASYVQRGFVMERVLKTPVPPLSTRTLMKSFGLTAVYQPLFPYVGVVTPKVHRVLFGDGSDFHQRVISTAMVSSSTALVVNPFEVLMLKVRTGVTDVNYLRGTVSLALRNSLVGVNLFVLYPEAKRHLEKRYPSTALMSPLMASSICATITTFAVMPLDVISAVLQKNANRPSRDVMNELKWFVQRHGYKHLWAGTSWRVVATMIECYLFDYFQKIY